MIHTHNRNTNLIGTGSWAVVLDRLPMPASVSTSQSDDAPDTAPKHNPNS